MRKSLGVFAVCIAMVGCDNGTSPGGGNDPGKGLGDMCGEGQVACRKGLTCDSTSMTCAGGMSTAEGEACNIGPECTTGYCAPNGRRGICAAAGTGMKNANCKGDGDCAAGLKCSFDGESLFPRCVPGGSFDIGHDCTSPRECAQGLFCQANKCTLVPVTAQLAPNGYPPFIPNPMLQWQGNACPAAKTTGITALFELPRAADTDAQKADFFRLPFPNDAARDSSGVIDFSRFPHDPAPPFGFDALQRYLDVLKTEPFSNYPAVMFRFDGAVKFGSFSASGANPQTRFVDLTPSRMGNLHGLYYELSGGRNRYVCSTWFAVRPGKADALLPGTYAVLMLKGVKADDDTDVAPSADMQAMVGSSTPTDPEQAAAYPKYAPLRAYLAMRSIAPTDVLVASVFTVGDATRVMTGLANTVASLPTPTADAWVKCGSGAPSPCSDATGVRACGNASEFDEWHTLIDLPIFQVGTQPYMTPAEGGNIEPDAGVVRREKICAALTTPKGAAPASGWPLVLYAHGTGGSFRSHAGDGSGAALSALTGLTSADGGALPQGYAVLGFDQVGHGPRRGARTDVSPDDAVFNFANPLSARGTMAQGSADLLSVARYAKTLDGTDAGLPVIDTTHLVYWGHSQGATEGTMFLANDRTIDGALLSGASASLTDALLSKRAPINIADSMWIALGEASPDDVDNAHPVLTLLQGWTDPVDPLNFARNVVTVPASGGNPAFTRNVLQIWGKGDQYTATPVQLAFHLASSMAFVGPEVDMTNDLTPIAAASISGNVGGGLTRRTAAMRQYDVTGMYDGHFVVFSNPAATRDAVRFLVRSASGEVPVVPEP